jgi:hypothetical protein
MAKRRDDRPLMWANRMRRKDNVIVLTDRAIFIATVPAKDFAQLDRAFAADETPQDVLDGYTVIPLKRIASFQYQHSSVFPNSRFIVVYDEDDRPRRAVLVFGQPNERDAFKVELNARLGNWLATEQERHPAVTLLKYTAILGAIVLTFGFVAVIYLAGWITEAPALFAWCVNLFGVWGILAAGALLVLVCVAIGVREFLHPILTVTCESPDDD